MSNLHCPVGVGYDSHDGKACVTIHIGANLGDATIAGISPKMARHVATQLLLTAACLDPEKEDDIYYHAGSGVRYRKLHEAQMETDGEEVVVYQCMEGSRRIWVRPRHEFIAKFDKEVRT